MNYLFLYFYIDRIELQEYFKSTQLSLKGFAKQFFVNKNDASCILNDLTELGILRATLFPDLDGMAVEMARMFRVPEPKK